MIKKDYILVVIIMIIVLLLFAIFEMSSSKLAINFLVNSGIFQNSKEVFKAVILTFYSLMGLFFILLALLFIRILFRLFKPKE